MDHQLISQVISHGAKANWIFGGVFCALFVGIALYAKVVPQGNRSWWGLLVLFAALITLAQVVGREAPRALLIDAAAFVGVAMVWIRRTPRAIQAARKYLMLLLPAVAFMWVGLYLVRGGSTPPTYPLDKVAVGLLAIGFGLKLALLPFYFWLPGVAESAAPMTSALIISVVDMAAFTELVDLRETAPWIFIDHGALWLTMALVSMYGGALLALAQRDLKRMLAFSTVDDLGYLLLGVLVGTSVGLTGALVGALSHSLVKVVLFGAVGIVEQVTGTPVTLIHSHGLGARFPATGMAFIVGSLGMIGLPPLIGFAGRWRLYLAGAEYGGPALVMTMVAASGLTLLYYVRAIHRVWLGPSDGAAVRAREPRLAIAVLMILSLSILLLGLFPSWVTAYFS